MPKSQPKLTNEFPRESRFRIHSSFPTVSELLKFSKPHERRLSHRIFNAKFSWHGSPEPKKFTIANSKFTYSKLTYMLRPRAKVSGTGSFQKWKRFEQRSNLSMCCTRESGCRNYYRRHLIKSIASRYLQLLRTSWNRTTRFQALAISSGAAFESILCP